MFLKLFALLMVMPWVLSDKVSTKPGLKMFRDEYKSIKETCLDLGFVKKSCTSGSGINSPHILKAILSRIHHNNNRLYEVCLMCNVYCLFTYLFGVFHPTREFFNQLQTSQ